jgi:hypothetical protein
MEHTELLALVCSAAKCFVGSARACHIVTIDEFGPMPIVVLAAASEVYRGELSFGTARESLALSAVRFPGAFVYDTESAARWICHVLTGDTSSIQSARLSVAVHDVIDYWGIDLLRPRVERLIAARVDHTDACAVWHYARDRVGPAAQGVCARALAQTMFVAADVELLDEHDVRALVDAYPFRTLTLFHGLARWLRATNDQNSETGIGAAAALGAIYFAAAECISGSFFSTGGADMDVLDEPARALVSRLVLDLLGRDVVGKRKRYSCVDAVETEHDEVRCTAPNGSPPPVTVRADGTVAVMGVAFDTTNVVKCTALHFTRGTIYALGPVASVAITCAGQTVVPAIDAAVAFEFDAELHALDSTTGAFVVLRENEWRASLVPSPHTDMRRARGLSFVLFHGTIYAIAQDGSLFRYKRPADRWERRFARCEPNSRIHVADGEILLSTCVEATPLSW